MESRQQEVAEFSRSLKLLAKELGVPTVASYSDCLHRVTSVFDYGARTAAA